MKRWNALVVLVSFALSAALRSTAADEPAPAAEKKSPTAKEFVLHAHKRSAVAKSEGDFAAIIYLLDRALRSEALTPKYADYAKQLKGWAHNKMGEVQLEKDRESAALAQFERAVELNPEHWKARHNRGVSYAVSGEMAKALKDFTKVIELKPKFANAWFNRAEAQMALGKVAAAITDYSAAVAVSPRDAGFHFARAAAYRQHGKTEQALHDYTQAIELDTSNAAAYVGRGDAYSGAGNYAEAAADFRKALKLDKQSAAAYRGVAWMMSTCPDIRYRDSKRAVSFAERAIKLAGDPGFQFYETLAAGHAAAGAFGEAVAVQQKAISLAATDASDAVLGRLRAELAQYERGEPFPTDRVAAPPQAGPRRQ
ncbi:MAG: tetratricopeptide repeat protein [Pirellulales bacterium]